jgi:cobalt-zinc-cadmium resistance protein CzcA
MLDIRVNRDAMARLGVTAQDVQDTVTATIGGRTSGQIFEGDRRFPVVIRLSEAQRSIGLLQQVQVPVAGGSYRSAVQRRRHRSRRRAEPDQPRERQAPGGGAGQRAWSRRRSVVADAQAAIGSQVRLPAGQLSRMGRPVREPPIGQRKAEAGHSGLLRPDPVPPLWRLGSVRDAAIVFTGVPFALVGGVLLFVRGMDFRSRPRWASSRCPASRSSTASSWSARSRT